MIDAAARNFVRRRADNRCEYCLLRQEYSRNTLHIEHIVAKQHGGSDDLENLALACHRCNLYKGPRATVLLLGMNHPRRLDLRTELLAS